MNRREKRKSNQGNTFIIVIATLSFLAVLATSLLVAVAVCYRMKAYDINSRDNFYYLEQAMDELYAGVGSIAMEHLNEAYNDVTNVIVVYDTNKKAYVTMDNSDANVMLDKLFMDKIKEDARLKNGTVEATLRSYVTNLYDASSNTGGIQLSAGNVVVKDNSLSVQDVVLKRTAEYSTVNAYKDQSKMADKATYVQSITTDLVLSAPEFSIDFSSINNDPLFDFSLISDMGVEIEGLSTKTFINGNVYAANDFYNKDYNYEEDTNVTPYSDGDSELDKYDGLTERSMYSGLYIDRAKVSIVADRLIVPGSIAAMNCADLSITGSGRDDKTKESQVWTDNIILGGYSRKIGTDENDFRGADLEMNANAYVSDDLELNAAGSKYVLDGNYYGYNNATKSARSYSRAYLAKVLNSTKYAIGRKSDVTYNTTDGNYVYKDGSVINLPGQSHYNSSSVVVNGKNSELDLSETDSVYIAGQAYVEMSKDTKSNAFAMRTTGDAVDVSELKEGVTVADVEAAESNPYTFNDYNDEDDEGDDYYTSKKNAAGTAYTKNRVDDYRTRESLSVKSNQLAYIPPYHIQPDDGQPHTDDEKYVEWPELLVKQSFTYKDDDGNDVDITFKDVFDNNKIPLVRTVVGGDEYYFYDFSEIDPNIADAFIENYGKLFAVDPAAAEGTRSIGDMSDLYDITNWEQFKVKSIVVDEDKLYTNSAISVKKETESTLTVKGKKDSILPLFNADSDLELGRGFSDTGSASKVQAAALTSDIQDKYKAMKVLLTDKPTEAAAANDVTAAVETSITPINTYFDFKNMVDYTGTLPKSNYKIFSSTKDVKVTGATNGKLMGVVICKGDVTFDDDVKEFHGLIVCGGKIKVDDSINFIANREIVKAVLDECSKSNDSNLKSFLKLFKHYYREGDPEADSTIVSLKNVSSVQYEDILGFSNWRKNVD